jgi:hypothetical protein
MTKKDMESKLDNGLIKGHAYSLTAVAKVILRVCFLVTIYI